MASSTSSSSSAAPAAESTEEMFLLKALPSFADVGSEGLAEERLRRMQLISGEQPASRCDNRAIAVVGQKVELVPYRPQHVPQMHQWFMEDEELADTMCGCTTLPQEYRQREKWQDSPEHISFLVASRADFGQIIGDVHLLFEKDEPNEEGDDDDDDEGTVAVPPASGEDAGEVLPPSGAKVPQNLDDWTREKILGPEADGFFHEAEILVMVADPAFRRGGFATEAVVRLMQYGAAVIGARRFIAKIDDSNEASLGLFTNRLGFRVYERNEDFEMTHVELSGERLMSSLFDPSFEGGLCARFGLSSARNDSPEADGVAEAAAHDQKYMTQAQLDRAKAALDHVNNFKQKLSPPSASSSGGVAKPEAFEVQPSRFFAEPVDLDYYEGYTDIVARPLDLGKVAENLAKDVYTSPAAFRVDVQTTFSNLLAFNNDPLETRRQFPDPRSCAFTLLDEFQNSYEDYSASLVAPAAAAGANAAMSLEDKQRCRKRLDVLLLHRIVPQAPAKVSGRKNGKVRTCGPFVVPVMSLGLPDYEAKVSRPMDLCHVSNTLNTDGYASPAAFAADVELTFQNALRYGGEIAYEDPDTEVQCLVPALAKVALETWKTLVPSV